MTRAERYAALRDAIYDAETREHFYLSTGCLHEVHQHCQSIVAITGGEKIPGVCKWCPAICVCPCHPVE